MCSSQHLIRWIESIGYPRFHFQKIEWIPIGSDQNSPLGCSEMCPFQRLSKTWCCFPEFDRRLHRFAKFHTWNLLQRSGIHPNQTTNDLHPGSRQNQTTNESHPDSHRRNQKSDIRHRWIHQTNAILRHRSFHGKNCFELPQGLLPR